MVPKAYLGISQEFIIRQLGHLEAGSVLFLGSIFCGFSLSLQLSYLRSAGTMLRKRGAGEDPTFPVSLPGALLAAWLTWFVLLGEHTVYTRPSVTPLGLSSSTVTSAVIPPSLLPGPEECDLI